MTEKVLSVLELVFRKLTSKDTMMLALVIALIYVTLGAGENPRSLAHHDATATTDSMTTAAQLNAIRTDMAVMHAQFDAINGRLTRIEANTDRHNNP